VVESGLTHTGRLKDWDNKTPLWHKYEYSVGPSRHLTVVFNVFVLMQIFNMINARKIRDEFNIVEGLTKSTMFLFIWAIIFVV